MIIKNRKTDYNHMNNQKQYNISTNTSLVFKLNQKLLTNSSKELRDRLHH